MFSGWSVEGLVFPADKCGMFFLNTWTGFVLNVEVAFDFRCLEAYVCLQGGRSAQLTAWSAPCFTKKTQTSALPITAHLKNLAFSSGNAWNCANFPSPCHLPSPISEHFFWVFWFPFGMADIWALGLLIVLVAAQIPSSSPNQYKALGFQPIYSQVYHMLTLFLYK